jgi:hypothetical protein
MAGKTRSHDRHHIPAPVTPTGTTQITPNGATILADKAFLDGFKERIHDLFLTAGGMPGHVIQVQQEYNRLNNSTLADDRKRLIGDTAFDQICKAAEHAGFNFPQETFTIASVGRTYYIERAGGKVIRATS